MDRTERLKRRVSGLAHTPHLTRLSFRFQAWVLAVKSQKALFMG